MPRGGALAVTLSCRSKIIIELKHGIIDMAF